MKTKNIFKSCLAALALVAFNSCDTENINELQKAATEEAGAYARVISISEDTNANISDVASSTFDVEMEFVDEQSGGLVVAYRLFATFRDNTIADEFAPDHSINTEALVYSYDSSSFGQGEVYPTLAITVRAQDAIAALGLDLDNSDGGDALHYRGEIELSDGRIFSSTNSGKSITSELFYNDAFGFTSQFVCIPPNPLPASYAGDWIINGQDDWGDGWNGAAIRVTIDGVATDYGMDDGASISHTVTVPPGTNSFSWEYISGDWDSEVTFQIFAPNGSKVIDQPLGPVAGPITLNFCGL